MRRKDAKKQKSRSIDLQNRPQQNPVYKDNKIILDDSSIEKIATMVSKKIIDDQKEIAKEEDNDEASKTMKTVLNILIGFGMVISFLVIDVVYSQYLSYGCCFIKILTTITLVMLGFFQFRFCFYAFAERKRKLSKGKNKQFDENWAKASLVLLSFNITDGVALAIYAIYKYGVHVTEATTQPAIIGEWIIVLLKRLSYGIYPIALGSLALAIMWFGKEMSFKLFGESKAWVYNYLALGLAVLSLTISIMQ